MRRKTSSAWRVARYITLGTAVTLATWAFAIEPGSLRVEQSELPLPGWDRPPLRIALLADLHVGSPRNGLDKLEEIVERTNASRPDLVLLLGDLVIHEVVGGSFVPPEEIAPVLARLTARHGVWAVLGNHDHWLDAPRVARSLTSAGIPVLEDRSAKIQAAGFWLAGVSDYWEGAHDIAKALSGVTDDAPVLLFTHNPDIFPDVPPRVTLTLAGHTHGGQVYFPVLGRLVVPSRFGERYAIGHVAEGGRHLFVSPGTGTSILPVRFLVPPEISIVRIVGDRRGRQNAPAAEASSCNRRVVTG